MSFLSMTNPLCLRFLPGRKKISGVLFALTAWAYLFFATWTATTLKSTHKAWFNRCSDLMWIVVIVAAVNLLLLADYTIRDLLIIILAAGLFYATTYFGGSKHLVQGFILAMSGRHVNWKVFMGCTTVFYGLMIAGVIAAYFLGELKPVYSVNDGFLRATAGFNDPTVFAGYLMTFCLCWMMWRFEKLGAVDYIVFAVVGIYCLIFPDNLTVFAVIFLMLIALPLFQFAGDWMADRMFFRILFALVFPAVAVGSVLASRMYWKGGRWFKLLDKALAGKISIAHAFMNKYKIPLLGQNIGKVKRVDGKKVNAVLENSYVRLLLENGVIAAVVVLILFTVLVYMAMKHHRMGVVLGLMLMAVYGLVENRLVKVAFDVPMLAMPLIFYVTAQKRRREPARDEGRGEGEGRDASRRDSSRRESGRRDSSRSGFSRSEALRREYMEENAGDEDVRIAHAPRRQARDQRDD